jgi:DNA polymerase-3 subunit delta
MNIDKILEDFQNSKFAKVYFLKGEEEIFKYEFLQGLKKEVVNPEFNWNSYYAEEIDSTVLFQSLLLLPFLSQLKIIVIKNAENLSSEIIVQLSKNINRIPSTNRLILCASELPSKVEQLINQFGKIVSFTKPTRYQAREWISKRLKENSKRIDSEAVSLLLENTNGNISLIARELDKLISYIGKRTNIGLEDVEKIGIDTKTYTVFELIDKISEKNTGDSLNILQRLLVSEVTPQQIIGLLRWQFTKLWKVKALISNGLSSYKASVIAKIPSFKRKDFLKQIRNFSWEELRKCFNLLLDTDVQIKRGAQADLSLELLLFRLTR